MNFIIQEIIIPIFVVIIASIILIAINPNNFIWRLKYLFRKKKHTETVKDPENDEKQTNNIKKRRVIIIEYIILWGVLLYNYIKTLLLPDTSFALDLPIYKLLWENPTGRKFLIYIVISLIPLIYVSIAKKHKGLFKLFALLTIVTLLLNFGFIILKISNYYLDTLRRNPSDILEIIDFEKSGIIEYEKMWSLTPDTKDYIIEVNNDVSHSGQNSLMIKGVINNNEYLDLVSNELKYSKINAISVWVYIPYREDYKDNEFKSFIKLVNKNYDKRDLGEEAIINLSPEVEIRYNTWTPIFLYADINVNFEDTNGKVVDSIHNYGSGLLCMELITWSNNFYYGPIFIDDICIYE